MPHTLRATLASFAEPIPLRFWSVLITVAVVGSCLYGASFSLVFPEWLASTGALWLTLSAGFAWCVFIPCLCAATRLPFATCFTACLVAMAGGEVVLVSGALVNVLLRIHGVVENAVWINVGTIAISNVAMLVLLATDLRRRGVSLATTITTWMLVLNGSGAALFYVLFPLLHGV